MSPAFEQVFRLQRLAGNRATASLLAVQRFDPPTDSELMEAGAKVEKFSAKAPAADALVWQLTGPQGQRLVLLGTIHVSVKEAPDFKNIGGLLDYLEKTQFDGVFEEIVHEQVPKHKEIAAIVRQIAELGARPTARVPLVRYNQKRADLEAKLGSGSDPPLVDDFFSFLAAKGAGVSSLESDDIRKAIRKQYEGRATGPNAVAGGFTGETKAATAEGSEAEGGEAKGGETTSPTEEELVYAGNQKELSSRRATELKEGKDRQDVEARNRYWLTVSQQPSTYEAKTVLWVVGAGHIGGIAANLKGMGWKAAPVAL